MRTFLEWLEHADIREQLKSTALKQLEEFPDPDYGILFWNPRLKQVHWVCGDGAGGWKEAEDKFNLPGVERVVIADEYMPNKTEPGWERIPVKPRDERKGRYYSCS